MGGASGVAAVRYHDYHLLIFFGQHFQRETRASSKEVMGACIWSRKSTLDDDLSGSHLWHHGGARLLLASFFLSEFCSGTQPSGLQELDGVQAHWKQAGTWAGSE